MLLYIDLLCSADQNRGFTPVSSCLLLSPGLPPPLLAAKRLNFLKLCSSLAVATSSKKTLHIPNCANSVCGLDWLPVKNLGRCDPDPPPPQPAVCPGEALEAGKSNTPPSAFLLPGGLTGGGRSRWSFAHLKEQPPSPAEAPLLKGFRTTF